MCDHVPLSHDHGLDGFAVAYPVLVDLEIHLKADDEKVGDVQHMENTVRYFLVTLL
jgi:hypothetical protein